MGPVLESANVFSANETFPPMIQITLNGQTESLPATTSVLGLLENRALAGKRVAVERNGEIVPKGRHADTVLADGDRLEIVVAVGGG